MKLKYLMVTAATLLNVGQVFASSHFDAEAEGSHQSQSRNRAPGSGSYIEYDIKELEAYAQKLTIIKKIKETEAELPLIAASVSDRIEEMEFKKKHRAAMLEQLELSNEGIRNKNKLDEMLALDERRTKIIKARVETSCLLQETQARVDNLVLDNINKQHELEVKMRTTTRSLLGAIDDNLRGVQVNKIDSKNKLMALQENQARENAKVQNAFSVMLAVEGPQQDTRLRTGSGVRIEELG